MKRIIALLLALVMCFALFSGCGSKTDPPAASEASVPAEQSTVAEAPEAPVSEAPEDIEIPEEIETYTNTYPLVEDGSVELDFWTPMEASAAQMLSEKEELQLWAEMEKITGVKVNLNLVVAQTAETVFALTIAGGDSPDLWMDFHYYTNGWDHAIEEGIVEPLNDYLEIMPNLNNLLAEDPDMRRQCYTDSGYFAGIPSIKVVNDGQDAEGAWLGYTVRKDWLEEMDMAVPETYDELEKVMDAMMSKYDSVKNPLYFSLGMTGNPFSDPIMYGGYGVTGDFIQIDGEVRYSPLEPGYKDYLVMLNSWVEKGYLSTDFPYNIFPWLDINASGDESYGVFPVIYTMMDGYRGAIADEDFDLVALRPLKINKEDTVHLGVANMKASPSGAISADSEHIEIICKWYDYLFGEEGIVLANYGIEGKTYEVNENGEKEWIGPFINSNNDPAFNLSNLQYEYLLFNMPGYVIADRDHCLIEEEAIAFINAWNDCETDYTYPAGAALTAEENKGYVTIYSDLNTYVTEHTLQFVLGERSFDEWDSFIETIKGMNAEEMVSYKQAALERYNNR